MGWRYVCKSDNVRTAFVVDGLFGPLLLCCLLKKVVPNVREYAIFVISRTRKAH